MEPPRSRDSFLDSSATFPATVLYNLYCVVGWCAFVQGCPDTPLYVMSNTKLRAPKSCAKTVIHPVDVRAAHLPAYFGTRSYTVNSAFAESVNNMYQCDRALLLLYCRYPFFF